MFSLSPYTLRSGISAVCFFFFVGEAVLTVGDPIPLRRPVRDRHVTRALCETPRPAPLDWVAPGPGHNATWGNRVRRLNSPTSVYLQLTQYAPYRCLMDANRRGLSVRLFGGRPLKGSVGITARK